MRYLVTLTLFAASLMGSSLVLSALLMGSAACHADDGVEAPRSRTFRLEYGAVVDRLPQGSQVRVWLPVPPSNEHQKIESLERRLPSEGKIATESKYGNQILYFEAAAPESGKLNFSTSYDVHRQEVRGLVGNPATPPLAGDQRSLFLSANKRVPLTGKQLKLLDGMKLSQEPLDLARMLFERVDDHVRYDKSKPGYGNGDVRWVCDSRVGNCTDFHSLFISLSRAKGLPARFEIGFPLPPDRGEGTIGGYHCWAMFYVDQQGWVPVDISEADKHPELKQYYFGNLTEDRVTFTFGRDIDLVPQQTGEPLNYFVYPYVEVDGKPWDKITMQFSFKDLQ